MVMVCKPGTQGLTRKNFCCRCWTCLFAFLGGSQFLCASPPELDNVSNILLKITCALVKSIFLALSLSGTFSPPFVLSLFFSS